MANIKLSIQRWCAYQERSSFEVTQKLISWNIDKNLIPMIIAELRKENFLNDERFAEDYARGKFRIKNWGKNKIKLSLEQKRVSPTTIDYALSLIDEEEYQEALKNLAEKKLRQVKDTDVYKKRSKVYQFLLSKGYENHLVREIIEEIV